MRRLRSLPIQVRITLGSLLLAGIVLAGVAALMAHQIRATTTTSEAILARSDIAPYIADLQHNPKKTPDKPSAGILIAIRAQSGAFLVNTLPAQLQRNLDDRDLHDRTFERVVEPERNAEAPTKRVTSGGTTYVVVERHLATSKGDFTLWAARSTTSGDLTIRALDGSLIVGLFIAFLAFGLAAWLLSTLSLRPVRLMTRSAQQLSRTDAGQRLPESAGGDELATLARTLNDFIGRLRASADHERQMVSDASHELRTPLTALTARLELAHRSFGDADALQKAILAAEASVNRLSDLTTSLLELSRLDQADPAAENGQDTSVDQLVAEALDAVDRARIGPDRGNVSIDYTIGTLAFPDARYAISPTAFGRLTDNLIRNAVTFSPDDGAVTVTLQQQPDASVTFEVRDDGPGIPEDFLPVAFDRFTRADESRRRIRGGSGLGLALVQGLATRAGGAAQLVNRPGGGTTATVELPNM